MTETISFKKGGFDVLTFVREAKDDPTKDFKFNLTMRYVPTLHKAISIISSSAQKQSDEIESYSPGAGGVIDISSAGRVKYTAKKIKFYPFEVFVEVVTYKSATGSGAYEALTLEKIISEGKEGEAPKKAGVNLPVGLTPVTEKAVEFIMKKRKMKPLL